MKSAPPATVPRRVRQWIGALSLGALTSCGTCLALHALPQQEEVTPQVQQLYGEAQAAQQRDDTTAAIQKYREMIRLAPHLAPAYNNLGRLYFNQHDYTHAAETLAHGLDLNPNMPTASAMLGMSYLETGHADKAEEPLEAALRANPKDALVQMALAKTRIRLHNYEGAAVLLKRYTDENPRDQQAWYLLGKTYLQLSEDSLGKINQIDPNSVVAHEVAGEIDESMHNYDGALVEYKKAIDLAPNQPEPHIHMANAYWSIAKWESARTEFEAGLVHDPNNCTAHWKVGNSILEANGDVNEALTHLNKAVTLCPDLMQARVDRARALIKSGKQQDALPDLQAAEKESPDEPSIHFLLASVYRAQGNTAAAQEETHTYGRLQRRQSEGVAAQANESLDIKSTAH
ncbi:MAG: tetratricopeptide repeat protein [Acidobacteriaceae bacterium]